MNLKEFSRKGGKSTFKKHGRNFMKDIGSRGNKEFSRKFEDPEYRLDHIRKIKEGKKKSKYQNQASN